MLRLLNLSDLLSMFSCQRRVGSRRVSSVGVYRWTNLGVVQMLGKTSAKTKDTEKHYCIRGNSNVF